ALYNPEVGTIHSWPWMTRKNNWPHNTIIDNMLNLELLFWSAKNGGNPDHYQIAVTHALTTLKNHFREDYSSYHVLVYDSTSPNVLQKITDQGYSDESVWARGQAWALYGYVLCYRETGMPEFKDAAIQIADFYVNHLPSDFVPYWDFKLPSYENQEKDASAAAIAASGLVELSELLEEKNLKEKYLDVAVNTINSLSSDDYLSHDTMAILEHSVGSKPHDSEVDVPLIYADYYYVEALLRLWKITNNKNLI
ncbi:MAG: glycoside hydrolase family 88 protein, partial [Bacteroidota bacterium]